MLIISAIGDADDDVYDLIEKALSLSHRDGIAFELNLNGIMLYVRGGHKTAIGYRDEYLQRSEEKWEGEKRIANSRRHDFVPGLFRDVCDHIFNPNGVSRSRCNYNRDHDCHRAQVSPKATSEYTHDFVASVSGGVTCVAVVDGELCAGTIGAPCHLSGT